MKKSILFLILLFTIQVVASQSVQLGKACGSIISDHQGNRYQTVQIGKQCWMAENMRCTTSPTGKTWAHNPTYSISEAMFASYYALPSNSHYGILYNWSSAMDLDINECFTHTSPNPRRGICPQGWHIPSSSEWNTLLSSLGGTRKAGSLMKGEKSLWKTPLVIANSSNSFSAIPAGIYTEDKLMDVGKAAFFWSSSAYDELHAWQVGVFHQNSDSYNCMEYKCYGCSVRCLKD